VAESYVAVVTGASRGAGKGIAIALGSKGATVYITGRSTRPDDSPVGGTVFETADAVTAAGGKGIPVVCDHRDDAQVKALFEKIAADSGRLDILVNNAAMLHDATALDAPFWQKPLEMVDLISVGLRSHYVSSFYAAPLMVAQRKGLIVNTGHYGSVCYFHGPAYGAQKAGADKMAADMAKDLRPYNVAATSIWMGNLLTERTMAFVRTAPPEIQALAEYFETPQYTGLLIDALFHSPERMALSGQSFVGAELGQRFGIRDINGKTPPSYREHMGGPPALHPSLKV
jgi:NAD(P)-dependent dehydrogenase (short-subunit alcohol dehydrogenase family)